MKVTFNEHNMIIVFSAMRSIAGFKRELDIPLEDIVKVRRYPVGSMTYKGTRWPGLHVPGIITAGTFFQNSKTACFWNVCDESQAIEISLKNHYYRKVIIDVENPIEAISQIKEKMENNGRDNQSAPLLSENNSFVVFEEDVVISSEGRTIKASLTYPINSSTKRPAVLLIPGSGPTDRNWNSTQLPGKNGSGQLVAQELASKGYVSIRYDKCGTGDATLPAKMSWNVYEKEQKAIINFLISRDDIDSNAIFVLGHSEGALHALRLASRNSDLSLKGLILLAPPGRTFYDILLSQVAGQLQTAKSTEEVIRKEIAGLKEGLDSIIEGHPKQGISSSFIGINKLYEAFSKQQLLELTQELMTFSPCDALRQLDIPTLIICGEKDLQTDPVLDAGLLSKCHRATSLVILPNANHVFKYEAKSREALSPLDALRYNKEDSALDPELSEKIATWAGEQLTHAASSVLSNRK